MTEIWKDIEGYNGIYQISNLGRVKSLGNTKNKKDKIIKPIKNNSSYHWEYMGGESDVISK